MICSDWAYTTNFFQDLAKGMVHVDSRVRDLVKFVKDHLANPKGIDPHIVRVEGPVEVITQPARTGALLTLNPIVLGEKAWCIVADIHSDCAGYSGAHPERSGDQYAGQARLIQKNAQQFINNVARQVGHPMRLIVFWTRFGEAKQVQETEMLADLTSQVIFDDDSWRLRAPAGLFDNSAMAAS